MCAGIHISRGYTYHCDREIAFSTSLPGSSLLSLGIYSRTPVTRTLKGDEKRFELAGVRVIGVDRKFNFSCK